MHRTFMSKIFALIWLILLPCIVSAQSQYMYEWKNGTITVRTIEEVDSITFSVDQKAVVFTTGDPTSLTDHEMTAHCTLSTSLFVESSYANSEQGVCYTTGNQIPTINDMTVPCELLNTTWTTRLPSLCSGTKYFYRPYLKIADVVFYGPIKSFVTFSNSTY